MKNDNLTNNKLERAKLYALIGTIKDDVAREKAEQLLYLNKGLSQELVDLIITNKPRMIQYIPEEYQTFDVCEKVIAAKPKLFKHIKNRSKEVCMMAIKAKSSNFVYIENPDEELQLEAVKKRGILIEYIENPSEEVCLTAVRACADSLRFIKDPSEEVCLAAIMTDPFAIRLIDNPSFRLIKAAFNLNRFTVFDLKSDDERIKDLKIEACRYAIRNDKANRIPRHIITSKLLSDDDLLAILKSKDCENIIFMLDNPTHEMKKVAVINYPGCILRLCNKNIINISIAQDRTIHNIPTRRYVITNEEEKELWSLALEKDPFLLKHIYGPSEDLCKIAINKNYNAYNCIINPSEEITKFALNQNGRALRYLHDNQNVDLCEIAIKSNLRSAEEVKLKGDELVELINRLVDADIMYLKYFPSNVIKKLYK